MADHTPAELFRSKGSATGIVFDDCLAVLEARAELFAEYRSNIRRRATVMRAACPDQACFESAARAFIEAIGERIPDLTIKAGVKRLAVIELGSTGAT